MTAALRHPREHTACAVVCKRCNDQGYVVEEWITTRLRPASITIKSSPAHWFTKGARVCSCNKDESQ